jgi:hypothetical protein
MRHVSLVLTFTNTVTHRVRASKARQGCHKVARRARALGYEMVSCFRSPARAT